MKNFKITAGFYFLLSLSFMQFITINSASSLDGLPPDTQKKIKDEAYLEVLRLTLKSEIAGQLLSIARSMLETHFSLVWKRPDIIIRTSSKRSLFQRFKGLFFTGGENSTNKQVSIERAMILSDGQRRVLDQITTTMQSIQKKTENHGPLTLSRHYILYGPPGVGKTMFARIVADRAYKYGMKYVEFTGSSLYQEFAGIRGIDEIFRECRGKNKGCIVIDEFDSVALRRKNPATRESKMTNHLLNYLGTETDEFMLIASTNRVEHLDPAMLDRCELVKFSLPDKKGRSNAFRLYRKSYLYNEENDQKLIDSATKHFTDKKIEYIAEITGGISFRMIERFVGQLRTGALAENGLLSSQIVDREIKRFKERLQIPPT